MSVQMYVLLISNVWCVFLCQFINIYDTACGAFGFLICIILYIADSHHGKMTE